MNLRETISDIISKGDIKKNNLIKQLSHLGFNIKDERMLRLAVEKMVVNEGALIGSSNKRGFFPVRTDEDLQESFDELKHRAAKAAIRANILKKNFYESQGKTAENIKIEFKENEQGQLELELS